MRLRELFASLVHASLVANQVAPAGSKLPLGHIAGNFVKIPRETIKKAMPPHHLGHMDKYKAEIPRFFTKNGIFRFFFLPQWGISFNFSSMCLDIHLRYLLQIITHISLVSIKQFLLVHLESLAILPASHKAAATLDHFKMGSLTTYST